MAEADPLECGLCARLTPDTRRGAGVEHPVGHVVERGHRVLEVEALEHEPDLVGAQPGELDDRKR